MYRHAWTTLFSSWRDGSNADHYLEASSADHLGRLCPEDPCLSRADHDVTVPHYGFAAKLVIRRHNAVFNQVSHWFAALRPRLADLRGTCIGPVSADNPAGRISRGSDRRNVLLIGTVRAARSFELPGGWGRIAIALAGDNQGRTSGLGQ